MSGNATIVLPDNADDRERLARAVASIIDRPEWDEIEKHLIAPNVERERLILRDQLDEKQLFRAQGRTATWDGIRDVVERVRTATRAGRRTI